MAKYKDYTAPERDDSDWLNLKDGDNKLRIVSEFGEFGRHYDQATKKTTTCIGKDKGCPECIKGSKSTVQFLVWAIDRADGQVKLFRYGYMIQDQIGNLAKSEEYAFDTIPAYDMTITKKGQGLGTEYTVMAARKDTPLTDAEKDAIELKAKPVEEIIEKMKAKTIPVDVPAQSVAPSAKTAVKKGVPEPEDIPIINTDEDIEDEEKIKHEDLPF